MRRFVAAAAVLAAALVGCAPSTTLDADPTVPADAKAHVRGEKNTRMQSGLYGSIHIESVDGRTRDQILNDMRVQDRTVASTKSEENSIPLHQVDVAAGKRCLVVKWVTYQDPPSLSMRPGAFTVVDEVFSPRLCFQAEPGQVYHVGHEKVMTTDYFWVMGEDGLVAGTHPSSPDR